MRSQVVPTPNRRTGAMSGLPIPVLEPPEKARFESKFSVTDTGCWLWTGALKSDGYGHFWLQPRSYPAHRVAYTLYVGPIPAGTATQ